MLVICLNLPIKPLGGSAVAGTLGKMISIDLLE
jgi:hypothetical protein